MKLTDSLSVGEKNHGIVYVSGEEDSVFVYSKSDLPLSNNLVEIFIPNKRAALLVDEIYDKMECVILSTDKTSAVFAIDINNEIQNAKELESWHYYKWLECPCEEDDDEEKEDLIYHSLKK